MAASIAMLGREVNWSRVAQEAFGRVISKKLPGGKMPEWLVLKLKLIGDSPLVVDNFCAAMERWGCVRGIGTAPGSGEAGAQG